MHFSQDFHGCLHALLLLLDVDVAHETKIWRPLTIMQQPATV